MSWSFYVTRTGNRVVKKELEQFGTDARAAMIELLKRADRGQALPREKGHVKGDIHYLKLSMGHNEYRLLCSREGAGGHILLALVAHIKKDERLQRKVIETAEQRLSDHRSRARVPNCN